MKNIKKYILKFYHDQDSENYKLQNTTWASRFQNYLQTPFSIITQKLKRMLFRDVLVDKLVGIINKYIIIKIKILILITFI